MFKQLFQDVHTGACCALFFPRIPFPSHTSTQFLCYNILLVNSNFNQHLLLILNQEQTLSSS